jgi:glycosyltransferase 2 family protein
LSLGHVDLLWLVAGVVLHLCSQLARGRGWHAIICAAHPEGGHPRRRDVLLTWVAGAGASGVLSARGGDALRILLLRRHMKTTCPTLVGTLAAETVAETALGALLTAWALSAGLIPGLHRPGLATALLIAAAALALVLAVYRAARRFPALGRACADARRGLALLGTPGRYVRRVASWGVLSRGLRIGSLLCLLAAFALPVSLTAALVVMVAHSSGRLVPFGPAGAGASLGLLVAAFPAVTHTHVSAGEITAFYLGATGTLTAVGIVLSGLVLVRELGLAGARGFAGDALERRGVPRKAPVRIPAA